MLLIWLYFRFRGPSHIDMFNYLVIIQHKDDKHYNISYKLC